MNKKNTNIKKSKWGQFDLAQFTKSEKGKTIVSLNYRIKRIDKVAKSWKLQKLHKLILTYNFEKDFFLEFKSSVKKYVSKALHIPYVTDDNIFMKNVDKARNNRTNITPNGAVVPKREFQLEYNLILRSWCDLVKKIIKPDPSLLTLFRITPNIRIKFGKELKDNLNRGLSTSIPHSDAWVEGPWGFNCFIPLLGDLKKNNLKYYEPISFKENFLNKSETYNSMQWVNKFYRPLNITPAAGKLYISDYSTIHHSNRKQNCKTRISIDTTFFVGKHLPIKDRIKEYTRKIPNIGIKEIVDPGQYEKDKFVEKKSVFSHYTGKTLKLIRLN